MNRYKHTLFFLLVISLLFSACAYQSLSKKAAEYEKQGMYKDAASLYFQSLQRNSDYLDAKLGLKRTGQKVIDDYLSKFDAAHRLANHKEAVYYYRQAEVVQKKAASYYVDLEIPPFYADYYLESKSGFLEDEYALGIKLIKKESFYDAEKVFAEIVEIDPYYKDAREQLIVARYEPKYRHAVEQMNQKKYRTAYYLFDEIIKSGGAYKDCNDLKSEAQQKATIHIGFASVTNKSGDNSINEYFNNRMAVYLNEINNPFIKLVEYQPSGQLPDALIKGEIHSINYSPGKLSSEEKPGYLRESVSRKEIINSSDYKKVKYTEYYHLRKVSMRVNCNLVNTKTNQVMTSHGKSDMLMDIVNYVEYSGDKSRLVPGYWKWLLLPSKHDVIKDNPKDYRELQKLVNGNKTNKTKQMLLNQMIDNFAKEAVKKIDAYNPD
jgi:tetratricopeptide (TPR) repeat protein